jgi:predicted dehydrogenase/threonine dehydrogenase-like Zn-dependent dehydrogenase
MSKQVLISRGSSFVADVPAPVIDSKEILVAVQVSCLSIGTEMSGVRSTSVPMWKRALNQPEKVATTLNIAASQGLKQAWKLVNDKKNEAYPTGYSAAGIVLEVGSEVDDIFVGDRVACAGAPHAELIKVTRNLCVVLPEEVDWESASTVTLGAIAMQGVRRAQPTLGECFVIIGLGILGQLTAQFLKLNGCRAIGIDLDEDRINTALNNGMDFGIKPDERFDIEQVARLTNGLGADGVIITAATPSDKIVSTAFKMCRKKGRVVLVGDVGLNLNRQDFYQKEIDFLISTSYGPGRYDRTYEEAGLDYPAAYVRWTENRNMVEYIKLLGESKISVLPLVSSRYDIGEVSQAYTSIKDSIKKPLMVLLDYPNNTVKKSEVVMLTPKASKIEGKVNIAVIGAGGFARATHLPNISLLSKDFELKAVVNRTGHLAVGIGKQFGASFATTNYNEILADPSIDAVLICTRHDQHTSMVLSALKAGKHVLVEKPLSLSLEELEEINNYISSMKESNVPVLLTGFNRRFSPQAINIRKVLENRIAPLIVNYRMNAGFIPKDHWVHGSEGGGRNIGEACHIYDLFTFLTDSKVNQTQSISIKPASDYYGRNDNFVTNFSFDDGSLCTLTYTALGSKEFPKEMAEIYTDGKIIQLEDYINLKYSGSNHKGIISKNQDKGHLNELKEFANGIKQGKWPIPWWQQYQAMKMAFDVEEQISK